MSCITARRFNSFRREREARRAASCEAKAFSWRLPSGDSNPGALKRLLSGCKHISSLDVHPGGDHVLVGSLDRRLCWFDLDRGSVPYKVLKYHTKALRGAAFHRTYPLLATCSDDGSCQVFHGTVYSDLNRDPYIVPLKVLSGEHAPGPHGLGILALAFHPSQPWLFSAGADGKIVLYRES